MPHTLNLQDWILTIRWSLESYWRHRFVCVGVLTPCRGYCHYILSPAKLGGEVSFVFMFSLNYWMITMTDIEIINDFATIEKQGAKPKNGLM